MGSGNRNRAENGLDRRSWLLSGWCCVHRHLGRSGPRPAALAAERVVLRTSASGPKRSQPAEFVAERAASNTLPFGPKWSQPAAFAAEQAVPDTDTLKSAARQSPLAAFAAEAAAVEATNSVRELRSAGGICCCEGGDGAMGSGVGVGSDSTGGICCGRGGSEHTGTPMPHT